MDKKYPHPVIWLVGLAAILTIGYVDYLTGYEVSFSIFYLFPIFFITWYTGKIPGFFASAVSMIAWLEADLLTPHSYSHSLIPYWNAFMRFAVFILVTFLIDALRVSLQREQMLARQDHLTRIANSRFFLENLQTEMKRSKRYGKTFSLAYIDVDNFKRINDRFGHKEGDILLQNIAMMIREQLREIDMVGRLGGDEFAILLPETNPPAARDVLNRLTKTLETKMDNQSLNLTLSIGCLTFSDIPNSADIVIKLADDLMYSVKKSGKNDIRFQEYQITDSK